MDLIEHLLFPRQAPPRGDPATTPVLPPPPGVKSNFVNPYSRGPMLVQLNAILLTLVMLFFIMRMYTRVYITRSVSWDDYTCVLGLALIVVHTGGGLKMLDYGMGRRGYNVSQKMYRRGEFIKWSLAIYMLEIAAPAVIKISILLLYLRLFSASRKMRLATYFMLAIVTSYMIAFLLALGFGCRPLRKLLNQAIPGKCVSFNRHVRVQAYVNAVTDIIVFLLPIPLSLKLQLPKRHKVALIAMFGIGSISCVATIARIHHTYSKGRDGPWQQWPGIFWATIEQMVAFICSCMPALKPFASHFSPYVKSFSSRFSAYSRSKTGASSKHSNTGSHHRHLGGGVGVGAGGLVSGASGGKNGEFVELTDKTTYYPNGFDEATTTTSTTIHKRHDIEMQVTRTDELVPPTTSASETTIGGPGSGSGLPIMGRN